MENLETLQNEYAGRKIAQQDYIKEMGKIIKDDAAKMSDVFYRMAKVIKNGNK